MTAHTAHRRRITTAAVLAAAAVASAVVTGGAASADIQPNQGNAYVTWLQARAEAAKPYSQGDDYVRTLVYWHHNPDWGFGS